MYLRPCRNCPKRTRCTQYKGMLESLRGKGITSAKSKCDDFLNFFLPGWRVKALLTERFEACGMDIDGTVTHISKQGKVTILLDEQPFEDSKNNFIRLWPKHIKALAEPAIKVCPECGIPEGEHNTECFSCYTCGENITPINGML